MYLCSCNIYYLPDYFQVHQQLERHADLYIFDFNDIVTIFDCISDCLLYQPVGEQD